MLETPLQQAAPLRAQRSSHTLAEPFVFVPITGTEAAKGRGAAKRIVRAHVTRVQHAKSSTLSATQDLQSWTVRPYIHRDHASVQRKAANAQLPSRRKLKDRTDSDSSDTKSSENSDVSTVKKETKVVVVPKLPTGSGQGDPFWSYPVEYRPELSPIFAHYVQNVAVDIADIDGPNEKGLLRRVWFPLCMTEAATMYAVLLMAASHYCIVNPSKAALIDLLHLKARALSEINTALADPKRAITDPMIGAVMKMAAYEAIFGESEVFAAHMRGLQMMLKIRGGLDTLGLNGLLERMLMWIDLNAAHITGMARQLETFGSKVHFAAPDPYHFAGIS